VLATLGHEIARGTPPPGSTLPPEQVLAVRFGVGRGVVREVVRMLAAKGMVAARPRSGTRIRPQDDWSLLDREVLGWLLAASPSPALLAALAEMRSLIEPEAAALAAIRADDAARARIAAALGAMCDRTRPITERAEHGVEFHLAILEATGNPVLRSLRGALRAVLVPVFALAVPHPDWIEANRAAHLTLGEAVIARNPAAARSAMHRVLDFTAEALAAEAATRPEPTIGKGVVHAPQRRRKTAS
jgi:GntR family galactonate operon transcriptional repressor